MDAVPFKRAACVGGGVIGGGWVARFALMGVDVAVFDPHPDAERIITEIISNAERAWSQLTMVPLPSRGTIQFAASIEDAVKGVQLVQESVPERLDLKRGVLEQIDAATPDEVLIGSSTSGLLPSDLQANMRAPQRLFVAHPYNPVYLLPLVELVGGKLTEASALERAHTLYASTGMKPITIAKEIDAFVGDRLLEAVWREALWLIKDDICDVETLDDVIRYSFGLRWAQMGLFQTYRVAGGEAGMRHFMEQFGPCLELPWTKLTDVPEFDDALVEKIATQSDEQAKGLSVRELERIRDTNLTGIMQALKAHDGGKGWGAGESLVEIEAALHARARSTEPDLAAAPLRLHSATVSPAWLDYNGHMTEFRYLQVLGDATDAVLRAIGITAERGATGESCYTVETHIRHLAECKLGDEIRAETQLVEAAGKRLHLFHRLINQRTGEEAATGEHMLIFVHDGKATEPASDIREKLSQIWLTHKDLPKPAEAGRFIGQRTS